MILEARYKNFKSMKNLTIFDMNAESICEFKDSILKWNRNKTDEYRIVPFKLLYGQNGSGKTSVMLGIDILKKVVSAGRIDIDLGESYESLVNCENKEAPISLGITFLYEEHVYSYDIEFTKDEVVKEKLSVNRFCLFQRNHMKLTMSKTNKSLEYLDEQRVSNLDVIERQFPKTRAKDLFVSQAFKSFIAPSIGYRISQYFEKHLFVYMNAREYLQEEREIENKKEVLEYLQEVNLNYAIETNIPLSNGVRSLMNFADLMFHAIKNNKVILLNEMDATFDPHRLIPLMSKLHDPSITNFESQLIFDTYNPVYLDKYFIRRDEISFVTNTEEGTTIRTLIEYANRENNYMRKYLSGEYETILSIDYNNLYQR